MKCKFIKAWIGKCNKETEDSYCEEHWNLVCSSCGNSATQECSETMGLVCGSPLCDDCEHTLHSNGCNSGGELPEGLGGHCRKDEQVYSPWYVTELR